MRGDKFILKKLWQRVEELILFFQEKELWWTWKKCIYVI